MAVNSFEVFRKQNGTVGLREADTGKEFYWDADRKGWYAQDEFGEFQIAGDQNRGSSDVQATDYAVAEQDGNTTLLVKTDDGIRFDLSNNLSNAITDVDYSENGDYVAVTEVNFGDQIISVYEVEVNTFQLIDSLDLDPFLDTTGKSCKWNGNNELFATENGGKLQVLDFSNQTLSQKQEIDLGSDNVSCDYNRSIDKLVASEGGSKIVTYTKNTSTGNYEQVDIASTSAGTFFSVQWNENDNRVAVLDVGNNDVYIYDENLNLNTSFSVGSTGDPSAGPNWGDDIAWRSDGYLVVGTKGNSQVEVYDDTFTQVDTISVDPHGASSLSFDQNDRLAIGSSDSNVYVFDDQFNQVLKFNEASDGVGGLQFNPTSTNELVTGSSDMTTRSYSTQRNQLNLSDSTLPDGFDLSVANDGTGIIEINEDGTTILSDVGNAPKVIDEGSTADISKIDNDRYLVEGDIYKEENGRFKKQA